MPDWTDLLQRRPDLLRVEGERRERMIQELADHLEDLYQEALRLGATEEEAEAQAFRSLSARDPKPARGAPGHLAARGPGRCSVGYGISDLPSAPFPGAHFLPAS
jgi:hypothetical protein